MDQDQDSPQQQPQQPQKKLPNTHSHQSYKQRQRRQSQTTPIIDPSQSDDPNNPYPQDMSLSPYTFIVIMLVMVTFFVMFILLVVWLLTPAGRVASATASAGGNGKDGSGLLQDSLIENLAINMNMNTNPSLQLSQHISNTVEKQTYTFLQQFLKTNNLQNQPADIFIAKYLLQTPSTQIQNTQKLRIQKQYYMTKYPDINLKQLSQLSQDNSQQSLCFCIVSTGYNNMAKDRQAHFLQSIKSQIYKNYKLVYIDDASSDTTYTYTKDYIQNIQNKLIDRSVIIRRDRRYYALANKILGIESYCNEGDVIVDVDADDFLIGAYGLQVLEYLYKREKGVWVLYTNYLKGQNILQVKQQSKLQHKSDTVHITKGTNSQIQFPNYRTSPTWVTSHLKTYRRELFLKIDQQDWKNTNGQFCHWASDRYIMYALLELAGPKHTRFQDVILYYYDYTAAEDQRNFQVIKVDKTRSQILVPYQVLGFGAKDDESKNINGDKLTERNPGEKPSEQIKKYTARKRQNYTAPADLVQSYKRAQIKYKSLLQKGVIKQ